MSPSVTVLGVACRMTAPTRKSSKKFPALDLAEKVERAKAFTGPKLFLALAVCPTGWGFDPGLSDEIAKLAVATGVWPLKEAVNGEVRHTYVPGKLRPVREYLEPQQRFRHLFKPTEQTEVLDAFQSQVTAYWDRVKETE